ncbi:hypothetical protein SAMN05421819_1415 [Bryocella elongata]|uniref:Uncharacterized protein n=1 Tax=Bryocella elongata TaxID=863522 RepID=A0A1H5W355_9BACT|nr:hypothetical protein [Bryocella elongata]SEF93666.1 hypothetical protein SAMN05421819_1415 [Bryocella elongata]
MKDLSTLNFDTMTTTEFSDLLPELMSSSEGTLSDDPRLQKFFDTHPDAAALVRDLEAIAEAAKGLFEADEEAEPADTLWDKIAGKLQTEPAE